MKDTLIGLVAAYSIPAMMLLLASGAFGDAAWQRRGCYVCAGLAFVVVTVALVVPA